MELRVSKEHQSTTFYKNSHLDLSLPTRQSLTSKAKTFTSASSTKIPKSPNSKVQRQLVPVPRPYTSAQTGGSQKPFQIVTSFRLGYN